MKALTTTQMRNLFAAIEVNVLLWLVVCGAVWASSVGLETKVCAAAGMIISALLQHWAYYNLYRKTQGE